MSALRINDFETGENFAPCVTYYSIIAELLSHSNPLC